MKPNQITRRDDTKYEIWILAHEPAVVESLDSPSFVELRHMYSTRKLLETGTKLGHKIRIFGTKEISLGASNKGMDFVIINNEKLELPDYVIPRTGCRVNYNTTALLRHLEARKIPVLNKLHAIQKAADKFHQFQVLANNGIPIPKTLLLSSKAAFNIIKEEFDFPVILKMTPSSSGKGVALVNDFNALKDYFQFIREANPKANLLVQKYIAHSSGRDVRVLVLGGKVLGAATRKAVSGFKSNLAQGGESQSFKLPPLAKTMAIKSAEVLGLECAGVDLLFMNDHEFCVCEVNSAPGFLVNDSASNSNLATNVFQYLLNKLEENKQT